LRSEVTQSLIIIDISMVIVKSVIYLNHETKLQPNILLLLKQALILELARLRQMFMENVSGYKALGNC